MAAGTSVLQVRDVPDDVRAALKERAAAAGTSLNRYVLALLARDAAAPSTAEVLARAGRRAERARASASSVVDLTAVALPGVARTPGPPVPPR